jgi:hypothetical protein
VPEPGTPNFPTSRGTTMPAHHSAASPSGSVSNQKDISHVVLDQTHLKLAEQLAKKLHETEKKKTEDQKRKRNEDEDWTRYSVMSSTHMNSLKVNSKKN